MSVSLANLDLPYSRNLRGEYGFVFDMDQIAVNFVQIKALTAEFSKYAPLILLLVSDYNLGMFKRSQQRLISFIALAAMLFASLAPTISHALEAQKGSQTLWQEVCGAQGIKFIPAALTASNADASKQNDSQPNKMGMHFEHCPYCFSHAGSVGLPASSTALFLAEINAVAHIDIYASPFVVSYYSTSHPTRAPPVL